MNIGQMIRAIPSVHELNVFINISVNVFIGSLNQMLDKTRQIGVHFDIYRIYNSEIE